MTSLVQANATYVWRHGRPLQSSCSLIIVCQTLWEECWRLCRAARSAKAGGLNRKGMSGCPLPPLALFTASTYFFLVVMVVSMTTGDLSNTLISTLILCLNARVFLQMWIANVHFTDNLDHIWGLVYSKVPTFTVLILPLKGLSYPKNNHHALFITFSMNARQCVASENVAQNHRNDRTEPLAQKIKSSFMSFTCGDRRSRLPELHKRFIWIRDLLWKRVNLCNGMYATFSAYMSSSLLHFTVCCFLSVGCLRSCWWHIFWSCFWITTGII